MRHSSLLLSVTAIMWALLCCKSFGEEKVANSPGQAMVGSFRSTVYVAEQFTITRRGDDFYSNLGTTSVLCSYTHNVMAR
jgi:hypothetical protein